MRPMCFQPKKRILSLGLLFVVFGSFGNGAAKTPLKSPNVPIAKVVFHNLRFKKELAQKISHDLNNDCTPLMALMNDRDYLATHGFSPDNILCAFIPNTYHVSATIDAKNFMERMFRENRRFWTEERLAKARALELNDKQVYILASIIQKETSIDNEKPMIAGVFVNRLHRKMKLQATPTVAYALNDFGKQVFTAADYKVASWFNTYIHPGLPPGPICMPSIATIDAVLNAPKTEYLYFCAKGDKTGLHNFAKTLTEHKKNVSMYKKNKFGSGKNENAKSDTLLTSAPRNY